MEPDPGLSNQRETCCEVSCEQVEKLCAMSQKGTSRGQLTPAGEDVVYVLYL